MKFILKNWVWTWLASMVLVIGGATQIIMGGNRFIAEAFLMIGMFAFVLAFIGFVRRLLRYSNIQPERTA